RPPDRLSRADGAGAEDAGLHGGGPGAPGGEALDGRRPRPAPARDVLTVMVAERAIRIEADGVRVYAVLAATPTAHAVWEALPLEGPARRWGDEIYFDVPLDLPLEKEARIEVAPGDLGYWPQGPAVALFFGPTPASTGPAPAAASPV